MSDSDDELEESHFTFFATYERSGPQPQMLLFLTDDDEAHGVVCLTIEGMKKVIDLGVSAWPGTNRVLLSGGKLPMTTLVSANYSGCITGVPKTSWRGRVKSWEHVPSDADGRVVRLVREAFAQPKIAPSDALAEIEAMDEAYVMPLG